MVARRAAAGTACDVRGYPTDLQVAGAVLGSVSRSERFTDAWARRIGSHAGFSWVCLPVTWPTERVRAAQRTGDLDPTADPRQLADLIFTITRGLDVLSRTTDRETLRQVADSAFRSLPLTQSAKGTAQK
jgi:hypothetical protein